MDKCIICGKEVKQTAKFRTCAKRKRVTCSRNCWSKLIVKRGFESGKRNKPWRYKNGLPWFVCEKCGKPFQQRNYYKARFCSWHCAHDIRKGRENWAWKGGRTITGEGYVKIMMPTHPFADKSGYVPEHRIVMEKYLGRQLGREEVVHHKNGIKNDNRIENLQLVSTSKKHKSIHPNVICPHCGKSFILVNGTPINRFI